MRTLRSVAELRAALAPAREAGSTIGLVPTMGALHEGHLSLIRRAREQCDVVVMSLFVNPAQFNEHADLERYPRSERHDAGLAAEAGADLLFAPSVEEVYPPGFATAVEVLGLTDRLEGAARGSSHFRGVTTVVTKLLCMTMPHTLYLGQKDAQQVVVIRRLVADLNLPVQIEALPTVREHDGLALSSRNALLDPAARPRALALHAALRAAGELAARGERSSAALLDAAHAELAAAEVRADYVALVDPGTLEPLPRLDRPALLAIAAHVGGVRLIDNITLEPLRSGSEHRTARNVHGASTATATIGERRDETPCSA
ncbi:MAG: pantoate--beta-alanine ligase [Solirubrobacteraceae bacterium]